MFAAIHQVPFTTSKNVQKKLFIFDVNDFEANKSVRCNRALVPTVLIVTGCNRTQCFTLTYRSRQF